MVLIESIMCGTPCISYSSGGIPEIVKDGVSGYCFENNEKEEMISKIIFLLTNQTELKKLSNSSREFAVANFSIEKTAQQYFDLFKKKSRLKNRD